MTHIITAQRHGRAVIIEGDSSFEMHITSELSEMGLKSFSVKHIDALAAALSGHEGKFDIAIIDLDFAGDSQRFADYISRNYPNIKIIQHTAVPQSELPRRKRVIFMKDSNTALLMRAIHRALGA